MKETDSIPLDKKVSKLLDRIHSLGLARQPNNKKDKIYVNTEKGVFYQGAIDTQGCCFGQATFYFPKHSQTDKYAVVLETHLPTPHTDIIQSSLIVFNDLSYYIGQVKLNQHYQPCAHGRGVMVNRQMVYDGTFQNGQPHGVGHVVMKGYRYFGEIDRSELNGKGLERTREGIFDGEIETNGKHGTLITRKNEQQRMDKMDSE